MGAVADSQVLADRYAPALKRLNLLEQRRRVEHHAGADHRSHPGPENAARDQVHCKELAVEADGVPGVGSTVIANDEVEPVGEDIDDLAFALIAPSEPNNTGVTKLAGTHSPVLFMAALDAQQNGA